MPLNSSLETVPLELLQKICGLLEGPDLHSLSYACKISRQSTTHLLFSGVIIPIADETEVAGQARDLRNALERNSSLRHVRRLTFRDATPHVWARERVAVQSGRSTGRHVPENPCAQCKAMFNYRAKESDGVFSTTGKRAWRGLVALIQLLPTLKRFTYACGFQLPVCLLDVLEQTRPDCGLYLETFCLRSLLRYPNMLLQVDSYELRLATSPSLCGINISTYGKHPDGIHDHNLVAVKDLLNGLAPNLKELNINEECAERIAKETNVLLPCNGALRQGTELDSVMKTRPSLTSLAIYSCSPPKIPFLASIQTRWVNSWSTLQSLQIFHHMSSNAIESIAHGHGFKNLKRLYIRIHAHSYEPFDSFFRTLPRLRDLEVHGEISDCVLSSILERHGPTLRRLILPLLYVNRDKVHGFSSKEIYRIRWFCRGLEELGVTIARSWGFKPERAIYKALAAFGTLQKIAIMLDCAVTPNMDIPSSKPNSRFFVRARDLTPNGRSQNVDVDAKVTRYQLRALLVNCAIDAELARSIFCKIVQFTREGLFPPQCVEIRSQRPGLLCGKADIWNLHRVAVELSRSWRCSLNFGDFTKPKVEEIELEEREARERDYDKHGGIVVDESVMAVFRELWPGKDEEWRSNWRSWPLWICSRERDRDD